MPYPGTRRALASLWHRAMVYLGLQDDDDEYGYDVKEENGKDCASDRLVIVDVGYVIDDWPK